MLDYKGKKTFLHISLSTVGVCPVRFSTGIGVKRLHSQSVDSFESPCRRDFANSLLVGENRSSRVL